MGFSTDSGIFYMEIFVETLYNITYSLDCDWGGWKCESEIVQEP